MTITAIASSAQVTDRLAWVSVPRVSQVPASAAVWLDGLDPSHLPDGRFDAAPKDVETGVMGLLEAAETPNADWRAWFARDCAALAAAFARQMGARILNVRLDRITDNACRRVHADVVSARMLCTYRGPSTLVVPSCHADDAAQDPDGYAGPFLAPQRFEAAILPGRLTAKPTFHRSPQIEGTGLVRLLLVVSPQEA